MKLMSQKKFISLIWMGFIFCLGLFAEKTHETVRNFFIGDKNYVTRDQKLNSKEELMEQLHALGYVGGTEKVDDTKKGVTLYKKDKVYDGYNLVTSGHASEAFLMDMEGKVLHTWGYDPQQIWPPEKTEKNPDEPPFFRRVHLFENGDLLAIYTGLGIIKLDKNSKLIWSNKNFAHHDMHVASDGNIYVLTREINFRKDINSRYHIIDDYLSVLNTNGEEIKKYSIIEILQNSYIAPTLMRRDFKGDVLHTNGVDIIEKNPFKNHPFKENSAIVSVRTLDLVFVFDLETEEVLWGDSSHWHMQHDPWFLPNGNLLVFDNQGYRTKSSVIELNPTTKKVQWIYPGNLDESFYTNQSGVCERLPNGNTIMVETQGGRVIEVTKGKEVVWSYTNPHRLQHDPSLMAGLYQVSRIGVNKVESWLVH